MFGNLEGKVALVTGGTGAMGTGVVRVLALAGAHVVVPWWSKEEVAPFQEAMEEAGTAHRVELQRTNVTDPGQVDALFRSVAEARGRLDILVNGVGGFAAAPLKETDLSLWERMISLNATSSLLCSRAAAPAMGGAGGRIVNVSAMPAVNRGAAGMSAYAASKAAVLSLTHSLSKELGSRRITVNAVLPTTIDTPANREAMPDADRSSWLAPDEIGEVIRFLVSDQGRIVTGAAITLGRQVP